MGRGIKAPAAEDWLLEMLIRRTEMEAVHRLTETSTSGKERLQFDVANI